MRTSRYLPRRITPWFVRKPGGGRSQKCNEESALADDDPRRLWGRVQVAIYSEFAPNRAEISVSALTGSSSSPWCCVIAPHQFADRSGERHALDNSLASDVWSCGSFSPLSTGFRAGPDAIYIQLSGSIGTERCGGDRRGRDGVSRLLDCRQRIGSRFNVRSVCTDG